MLKRQKSALIYQIGTEKAKCVLGIRLSNIATDSKNRRASQIPNLSLNYKHFTMKLMSTINIYVASFCQAVYPVKTTIIILTR